MSEKFSLPTLPQLEIKTPCHANWEEMQGDAGRRFCGQCEKSVYNFSEMDRDNVQRLLNSGESICARMKKRSDGSIVTREPVLTRRNWIGKLSSLAAGIVGLLMIGGCSTAKDSQVDHSTPDQPVEDPQPAMGGLQPTMGEVDCGRELMGDIAIVEPKSEVPKIMMGKVATPTPPKSE